MNVSMEQQYNNKQTVATFIVHMNMCLYVQIKIDKHSYMYDFYMMLLLLLYIHERVYLSFSLTLCIIKFFFTQKHFKFYCLSIRKNIKYTNSIVYIVIIEK